MSRARQVDPEPKVDLTVTFPGEFMASSGRMLRFEDNVAIWDDNLLEEIGDIMVAGVATASPSVSSPSVASEEPIEAAPTTVAEDLDAPPVTLVVVAGQGVPVTGPAVVGMMSCPCLE